MTCFYCFIFSGVCTSTQNLYRVFLNVGQALAPILARAFKRLAEQTESNTPAYSTEPIHPKFHVLSVLRRSLTNHFKGYSRHARDVAEEMSSPRKAEGQLINAEEAFDMLDINDDDRLDADELSTFLVNLGLVFPPVARQVAHIILTAATLQVSAVSG